MKTFFCFCKSLPIKPVKDSMVLFEHHLWSSGFQVIEIAKGFKFGHGPQTFDKDPTKLGTLWSIGGKKNNHLVLHTTSAGLLRDCPPNITCIRAVILLRTFIHPILGNKSRFVFVAHSWTTVFHAAQFVQF